ncbi:MAG: enoyl-CoA hydratase/isomerase family protein [Anaerolineales bacterium]|nr:enoyl-CoA hydratase/isomerase family protein [Anaerolineales bacterium]
MDAKLVLTEVAEGIGVLTINRPESLNALNTKVVEAIEAALQALEIDPQVKVVILTGAGEKAFVAGGDIKEMVSMDPPAGQAFARRGQQMILFVEKMSKPVLAAVNGYALGGGLELALACDFIYASEKARLGLPEVTLGIMPGFGGTQNLARLIGPNRARELVYSGKQVSAEQAREWGIVNAVFPPDELMPAVREIAGRIARNGSLAVGRAKAAIVTGLNMSKEDGFRYEAALFGLLFATEDQREGMQAFIEKRAAGFKDK